MNENDETILLSGGEIALWTDDDRSIHIKAVTPFGDPVELNAEEARELAEALTKLASAVD